MLAFNLKKKVNFLNFFFMVILIVACSAQSQQEITEQPSEVNISAEYIHFSREEMMREADIIFVGTVLNVSTTKWNQDSGEYWETTTDEGVNEQEELLTTTHSAWPVHEVELTVLQPIVGNIGDGETIILTIFGKSPIVETVSNNGSETVRVAGTPPHSLKIGQEIIVFAVRTEIAWYDPEQPVRLVTASDNTTYFDIGKRSIFGLIGFPGDSYLVKGEDGLFYSAPEASELLPPTTLDALTRQIVELQ